MEQQQPTAFHVRAFRAPLFLFLFFLCLAGRSAAQNSYIFTTDSGPYADLEGGTPLVKRPGTNLTDTVFAVDLQGETFRLYGREYRCDRDYPFVVYGGGFIRFNGPDNAVVIDGFLSVLDHFDEESRVSYRIEQNEEDRILKVEWKRMAVIDSPEVAGDYLSFQVWVYRQSGVVELRYGPRSLPVDSGAAIGGGPYVGIFRFVESPAFAILEKNWLIGDPFSPRYDTTRTGFALLEGCPREGTIFRFVPRTVSDVDEQGKEEEGKKMGEYRIFPNPTGGGMTLQAAAPLKRAARVRLVDMLGRTVGESEMAQFSTALDLELPGPGVYYCEVADGRERRVYSVVRQ